MSRKREIRRQYSKDFKEEAVRLIIKDNIPINDVAKNVESYEI